MNINYSSKITPKEYVCDRCNKQNVKLWRMYQTFASPLLCADCAGKDQKKNVSSLDRYGKHEGTDQIGSYIPAVPDEEGAGFWGYTSVPIEGVTWWKNLPNR